MPRKPKEQSPEQILDQELVSIDEGYIQQPEEEQPEEESPLYLRDHIKPEWHNYVMSQFTEDELDGGAPKADGLRRVAQLLIGEIVESLTDIVQFPTNENGNRACVKHTIVFNLQTTHEGYAEDRGVNLKAVTGVADCWGSNTMHPYSEHPTATAETRAEGRALRKALGIKTISAEEKTLKPQEEMEKEEYQKSFNNEGLIDGQMITYLNLMCERNDIDVHAFINSGKGKYDNIKDIPSHVANAMMKKLNEYFRGEATIPEELRGYKKG